MGNRSRFVGLDVHQEPIDVSMAAGDRHGEVRHYGVIASDLEPLYWTCRGLCMVLGETFLYTLPPFMTKATRISAVMSAVGSPSTAIRSAS